MAHEDSRTAAVDSAGVLAECVMLPASGGPQYAQDNEVCQIRIKGPYDDLKDLYVVGMALSSAITQFPGGIYQNFELPSPPNGAGWYVTGTSLDQQQAGDHAIMSLTCTAVVRQEGSGSGQMDPYRDTWQLRWQSYTVKPAGFCKNEPHQDRELTSMTGPQEITGYADRQHINYFMQAGKDNCGFANGPQHYWYRTQDGDFLLNDAEQLVLKKTLTEKNALYHYPVLTHTTVEDHYVDSISSVLSNNVVYNHEIGDKVDHLISGVPEGCPYRFPSEPEWQWVKTGDDMHHVKTKDKVSFQRTETFMGIISADVNYYGNTPFNHGDLENCRWRVREV